MKRLGAKRLGAYLAIGFTLSAGAAVARPGCVYQDAHLRIGPGGSYPLIGTIPGPTPVVLVRLGEKWSIVSYDGETGYVATRHLRDDRRVEADPPPSRSSTTSDPVLVREIDPLFGSAWLTNRRYGFTRRDSWTGGSDYFAGFRRHSWTDRTNWRRPDSAESRADSPCSLRATEEPRRASGGRVSRGSER